MIRSITVGGFRPFRHPQTVRLGRITLIYGPNSAGKSALLKSLLLLKQTVLPPAELESDGARLRTRGEIVDLGSYLSNCHNREGDYPITIGVAFTGGRVTEFGRNAPVELPVEQTRFVECEFQQDPTQLDESSLRRVRVGVASAEESGSAKPLVPFDATFYRTASLAGTSEGAEPDSEVFAPDASIRSLADHAFSALQALRQFHPDGTTSARPVISEVERRLIVEKLAQCTAGSAGLMPGVLNYDSPSGAQTNLEREVLHHITHLLHLVHWDMAQALRNVEYLGPLRQPPQKMYSLDRPSFSVNRWEVTRFPWGLHREGVNLTRRVNEWLHQLGYEYTVGAEATDLPNGEPVLVLHVTDDRTSVRTGLGDVGFGLSQVLPILAVLGSAHSESSVIVEQPELHLHPRLQGNLADFFVETSRPPQGLAWLIETHSEAIISRLQRRIRQGLIPASDLSVIYVEPSIEGARLLELRVDESGRFIDEWPGGFFEETYFDLVDGLS